MTLTTPVKLVSSPTRSGSSVGQADSVVNSIKLCLEDFHYRVAGAESSTRISTTERLNRAHGSQDESSCVETAPKLSPFRDFRDQESWNRIATAGVVASWPARSRHGRRACHLASSPPVGRW
jgi:hypothetical protein